MPTDRVAIAAVAAARQELHDRAWETVVAFHRAVLAAIRPTDIDPAAVVAEAVGGRGTAARRRAGPTRSHPTAGDGVQQPLWELLTGGGYQLPLLRALLARAGELHAATGSPWIVDRGGFVAAVRSVVTPLIEPRIEAERAALAEAVRLAALVDSRRSLADHTGGLLGDAPLVPPPRDALLARSHGGARLLAGALQREEGIGAHTTITGGARRG